ncbi:MAG TPA: hypothetical protein P5121_22800 [Caldilineaceae bacterium]|nr:hypothetical protein [Caldilineaceae bacterium]HRW07956.1 hypothetical protein [Caldilineaceae bacterium]
MIAFQFPTQVTNDGDLALPSKFRQSIPPGSTLQVVLLVDAPSQSTPVDTADDKETLSLADYVHRLQQRPLPQASVTAASGLLAEHLTHPSHASDPDFDEVEWNDQWDQLEAAMNANELAEEQHRLQAIQQDLA